ncbi:hypothetical protein ACQY0O_004752 [Thecaphora frezii]
MNLLSWVSLSLCLLSLPSFNDARPTALNGRLTRRTHSLAPRTTKHAALLNQRSQQQRRDGSTVERQQLDEMVAELEKQIAGQKADIDLQQKLNNYEHYLESLVGGPDTGPEPADVNKLPSKPATGDFRRQNESQVGTDARSMSTKGRAAHEHRMQRVHGGSKTQDDCPPGKNTPEVADEVKSVSATSPANSRAKLLFALDDASHQPGATSNASVHGPHKHQLNHSQPANKTRTLLATLDQQTPEEKDHKKDQDKASSWSTDHDDGHEDGQGPNPSPGSTSGQGQAQGHGSRQEQKQGDDDDKKQSQGEGHTESQDQDQNQNQNTDGHDDDSDQGQDQGDKNGGHNFGPSLGQDHGQAQRKKDAQKPAASPYSPPDGDESQSQPPVTDPKLASHSSSWRENTSSSSSSSSSTSWSSTSSSSSSSHSWSTANHPAPPPPANVPDAVKAILNKGMVGRGTFFTPGLGACGQTNSETDSIVAVSKDVFEKFSPNGNPNHNHLCNLNVKIHFNGKTANAKITDECPTCPETSLDLSPTVFNQLEDPDKGVMSGMHWTISV